VVGHITPESYKGGNIAIVQDDDTIRIDAKNNSIDVLVSEEEIARRRAAWTRPPLKAKSGLLYKYALQVSSAAEGCVTDEMKEQ
jgi:dihydroxy-acid dehydratase